MRGNRFIDITGQVFDDLTVIKLSEKYDKYGHILWKCRCICNNIIYVTGSSLRAGVYKSCGCKRDKKRDKGAKKHIKQDRIDGTRKSALKAKLSSRNSSGHKGVSWVDSRKKWRASIGFKGKQITIGYFDDIDDAVNARQKAEKKYHKPILEDDKDDR